MTPLPFIVAGIAAGPMGCKGAIPKSSCPEHPEVWCDATRSADGLAYYSGFEEARLGSSLAHIGDLDADGNEDILVGSPTGHLGFVVSVEAEPGGTLADAAWTGFESSADDELTAAAVGPGDIDGDGHRDLAIGAPAATDDDLADSAGRIYVWAGPMSGVLSVEDATWSLNSGVDLAPYVYGLGASLAAGDFDHDGIPDIASADSQGVRVWNTSSWTASSVIAEFTYNTAIHAAEMDGDGIDDLLFTALVGGVALQLGQADPPLWNSETITVAGVAGCGIGSADIDGDGAMDVVLGGILDVTGSRVRVYPGPFDGLPSDPTVDLSIDTLYTEATDGACNALGADLDGDGWPELVGDQRSAHWADLEVAGVVAVLRGPVAPGSYAFTDADILIHGEQPGDLLGNAVLAVDSDLWLGAGGYDDGGSAAGAAFLLPFY